TAILLSCNLFAQVEPNAGKWKTWVITTGSAFRIPPPPDPDATVTELKSVKDAAAQRDQATLNAIRFWDAAPPAYRRMQSAEQSGVSAGLPAPLQTRALVLVAAAISDATISAWDSKYVYLRAHPSDLDSSVTLAVAVPRSPSYPSEHAVAAGA